MRLTTIGTIGAVTSLTALAHADPLGFVGTIGGQISSVESFNSAGGTNSITFVGNTMQVTLPGLGNGLNSNVQVSALNTNGSGHYCTVIDWFSSDNVDVTVNVACFNSAGSPELADFAMLYQARTVRPTGADIAFVWANQPTSPSYTPDSSYSFNSIGGPNSITRSSPGNYTVILGDFQGYDTSVQVTAYGSAAARCEVAGWTGQSDGAHVNVICVNSSGTPTDEYFSLTYTLGGVEGSGNTTGAFAWANKPKPQKLYKPYKPDQFSNISQAQFLTAQRFGGLVQGQYSLNIPNPGHLNFPSMLGMVTAYGSSGEYCDVAGISVTTGQISLESICYGPSGIQSDAMYTGTLLTIP